ISSFSPASGSVGAHVTLTGSGFTGATAVAFAGTAASFAVTDDAHIDTTVPFGATTGKIRVTTPSRSATSSTAFKVVPTVSGFSPGWGVPGTSITITGSAFAGASSVSFGGVAATAFTVDSYSQITASVPGGAKTGRIKVKTKGGSGTSSTRFRVLVAGPAWPQVRHDDVHSGVAPDETLIGPGNVSQLQLDWVRGTGARIRSSPAVANGIVYIGSDNRTLSAFDARTGTVLWSQTLGAPAGSSPAIAD